MKNFYEVGRVYVWQNQVGDMAHFNGSETTVTSDVEEYEALCGTKRIGQMTDSQDAISIAHRGSIYAEPGDLRPKDPPPGERSVLDLFKLPELECA